MRPTRGQAGARERSVRSGQQEVACAFDVPTGPPVPEGSPQDCLRAVRRVGGVPRKDETAARLGETERLVRIEDAARGAIRPLKRPDSPVGDPQASTEQARLVAALL